MSAPDLPQELVDEITDHIQDSPGALAACTLIGRTWLLSARRHLFRTISITPRNCTALIARSPSFAPYICTLLVLQDWFPPAADPAESKARETELERTLPRAARFACARALAAHPHAHITALHLHTVYLRQFCAALPGDALARVEELVLRTTPWGARLAALVQLIAACPRLRRLALRGPILWDRAGAAPTGSLSATLEELELDAGLSAHLFMEWVRTQDLSTLRTLRIPSTCYMYPVAQQLVDSVAPSLARLDINADTASHLDLARHTQLRTLTIVLSAWPHPTLHFGNLLSAVDTLRLDTVAVDLTLLDALFAGVLHDLPSLDAALVHFMAVPSVRVLTSGTAGAAERALVCSLMEGCNTRGVISFGPL